SSLQLRLSALQNDFAAEKSALKANQAALDKDLAREQAISTQKQKEIDSLYPLLAQSDQDIQRQTAVLDSLQRERVLLDATSAQIAAQEALLSRLQTGYDNLLALEQTIQQQQERLTSKAALQAQADGLPALEKTVEQHKNRLSAFRQQVQTLRQDAEKSRDGQCPILNTPCPNVSGNLSDFLLQKAHAIQQESDREAEQMLGPQASLEKARAAREALVSLAPVEEALEQNRSQREKYFHAFAHYTRQWAQESASVMPDLPQATDAAQWQQALVLLSRQQEADQSAYHTKTTALEQTKTACISSLSQLEEQKMSRQEKINAAQADKSVADLAILSIKQALGSQEQKRLQLAQQKQAIASLQSQLQSYDDLEQAILHTREQMQALLSQYEAYIQHRAEAQRLPEIQGEIAAREAREKERLTQRALLIQQQKSIASFDEAAYEALSARVESTIAQLAQTKGALDVKQKDHSALLEEIHALEARLKKAEELEQQHDLLQRTTQLSRLLFDTILRNAGERVAALYRSRITQDAAQLYREVSMENVALQWSADYDILLSDVVHGQERFRSFRQLSGGEQMTAALSVRLGLLNRFSSAGIAFFDEPTSNLDARRRENLAMVIPAVTSRFQQVFVISHDDAFDSITDSILRLTKAPGGTVVEK
ncbi:MAG: ATP-binding protein, partial [Christensenellales bacterium]